MFYGRQSLRELIVYRPQHRLQLLVSGVQPNSGGNGNPGQSENTRSTPAVATPAAVNAPAANEGIPAAGAPSDSGPLSIVAVFFQLPGEFAQGVPSEIGAPDAGPVKSGEPVGIISAAPDSSQVKDAEPELPAKLAQAPFNWNVIIFILADLVLIYVLYLLIFKRKLKK